MFYPLFYSKTYVYSPKTFQISITEIQSGDQERQATFGTKQTKGKTQSRKLKRLDAQTPIKQLGVNPGAHEG